MNTDTLYYSGGSQHDLSLITCVTTTTCRDDWIQDDVRKCYLVLEAVRKIFIVFLLSVLNLVECVGEDKDVKKVGIDYKDGDGAIVQRADVQRADGIVREPVTTREHHVAPEMPMPAWKHTCEKASSAWTTTGTTSTSSQF
jgi:hypothetical protein